MAFKVVFKATFSKQKTLIIIDNQGFSLFLVRNDAEREGFEPSIPCGIHAFQACSIGHSDISPNYQPM